MMSNQLPDFVLQVQNLSKSYPGVAALRGANLGVRAATVHGLLGKNGAGKSTLVNIIAGLEKPTSGSVFFMGRDITDLSVDEVRDCGVRLVTQEPSIVPEMTVAENLLLGEWPLRRGRFIAWSQLRDRARRELAQYGIDDIEPTTRAGKLSLVQQRKLNIVKALFGGGQLLILDEPTTSLTRGERSSLFSFVRELKQQDITFIYISHYNEEILSICDEVTVLRDGSVAANLESLKGVDENALSRLVAGEGVTLFHRRRRHFDGGTPRLEVVDVTGPNLGGVTASVYPGEIVGLAGLPGSGAKEMGRVLGGLVSDNKGRVRLDGTDLPVNSTPERRQNDGIAFVPEDRRKEGVVGLLSIRENLALPSLSMLARGPARLIDTRLERSIAARVAKELAIRTPSLEQTVGHLSGGNQQKVVIGKTFARSGLGLPPKVIVLEEPTRGIDVATKEEIYRLLDDLSDDGVAVLVVTSELDEMERLVDRVFVFSDGCLSSTLDGDDITAAQINAAIETHAQHSVQRPTTAGAL